MMENFYKEYFYYDETSPSGLRWKIDYNTNKKGEVAGRLDSKGYWRVSLKTHKSQTLVHRIILILDDINIENLTVDHIDRNPSNNLRENLRVVRIADNMKNKSVYKNNISGVSGVYLDNNIKGNKYWVIQWVDSEGKRRRKKLRIVNISEIEDVKQKAILERGRILREILVPEGYTSNHGT